MVKKVLAKAAILATGGFGELYPITLMSLGSSDHGSILDFPMQYPDWEKRIVLQLLNNECIVKLILV